MAMTDQEIINKMYDSSLESQKQTLQQDYDNNVSNLEAEQQKQQKQTDANLNRTYVEAQKDAKNYAEVQNAYGLSSGAMAQAKLAQNNQMQSDMTTLRAAQQTADAEVERQRSLLAKEFSAAIAQAQADNDMQRAQALYEQAKAEEAKLLQQQKEAASMLGSAGDYSLYKTLYGLTDEQIAGLENNYNYDKQAAAAELMASVGDYSLLAKLYGLTDEQVAALKAGTGTTYSYKPPEEDDGDDVPGELTEDQWNELLEEDARRQQEQAVEEAIVDFIKMDAQAKKQEKKR